MKNRELYKRAFCFFLVITLVSEIAFPTAAYALTSGPEQPETQSFEPVGTTEMVNLFSGDFNYNIPLLTVPGPNGGYPINLAYHAGITPDQEASWVGLGWNLNVGAVSRNMRGLPDDFYGQDQVKKTMSIKPNWVFGLDVKPNVELFGLYPPVGVQMGLYYNNYKGLGSRLGLTNLVEMKFEGLGIFGKTYNVGLGVSQINFDSQEGMTLKPKYSIKDAAKDAEGSTPGTEEKKHATASKAPLFPGLKKFKEGRAKRIKDYKKALAAHSSGISFANPSFSPKTSFPEGGFDASLWVKFGGDFSCVFADASAKGYLFFQHIKDNTLEYPSYGYLHLGERNRLDDELTAHPTYPGYAGGSTSYRRGMGLMDFNRYNDNAINSDAPNLAVPALTFDVFNATGQGIGMVFRPHRRDVGLVYDPRCTSDFTDANLGFEVGIGGGAHIGLNPGIAYTSAYTGKWKGQYNDFERTYEFTNSHFKSNDRNNDDGSAIFREPYYFKSTDDYSSSGSGDSKFRTDELFNFEITSVGDLLDPNSIVPTVMDGDFDPANYSIQVFPKIKNQKAGATTLQGLNHNKYTEDEEALTSNSIEFRTRNEMINTTAINSTPLNGNLYGLNQFPYSAGGLLGTPIDYNLSADKKGHHIAQFSIVNPDGNTYVYGLPVYNIKQKDAAFSTPNQIGNAKTIAYNLGDASTSNQSGSDRFFYSTETPAYANSYMLTAIYSADYIDVTSNGPSDDDMGYFVKFNYSPLTKEAGINPSGAYYKWRIPFSGAIRMENYEDHDGDDKAAYLYGEKEIYYLNSVETKSHFALFDLNDNSSNPRLDSYGATSENDNSTANPNLSLRPRFLQSIRLFSKGNLTTPLKTVRFTYDYSLCPNTPNSIASTHGKLTLLSVDFSYMNDDAGTLSPYKFTYDPARNFPYHEMLTDPWGTYKEDKSVTGALNYYAEDFPYTDQDKTLADKYAAAWCMTGIALPSGANIQVQYESDDYKAVQNKTAMQLLEIVGTGYDNDPSTTFQNANFEIGRQGAFGELHDLLVFKLKRPTNNQAELNNYITGIKNTYFRADLKLKNMADNSGNMAYDYVDGYCEMDKDYGVKPITDPAYIDANGMWTRAYVKLKYVKSLKIDIADDGKLHPFRKAAFEYMKLRRPELFYPVNGSSPDALSASVIYQVVSMFTSLGQAITGYNRYCKLAGFCKKIADGTTSENDDKKSYIRLNNPDGFKYGGGHRVARITIDDNWNTGDPNGVHVYGQQYQYLLPNRTSSGVAEYEPMFGGGAENPLKLPNDDHLNERTFIANLKELYQETPTCESYYPAPNVGYSRVIVRSLPRLDVNGNEINSLSGEGITVNEFHTAFDFPVKESVTKADNTEFSQSVTLPFIGTIKIKSEGSSQGYSIILNDMHGKPKAVKVYPHNAELFGPAIQDPVHEVQYKYSMNGSTFTSKVPVLRTDGSEGTSELGIDRDFVMDMDEQTAFTIDVGFTPNVEVNFFPPFMFPNVLLDLNYNHKNVRKFVNVKAIYRKGILLETMVKNDKAVTSTKNLVFDRYSGRPLLTQVNNEFDAPVYTYETPAYWNYKNMGSRSKTYHSTSAVSMAGSNVTVTYPDHFNLGDKVRLYNTNNALQPFAELWVQTKSSNVLTLVNQKGQVFSGPGTYDAITVLDPIKKNQLNVNAGKVVSLSNPVSTPNSAFFAAFNNLIQGFDTPPTGPVVFTYANCLTGLKTQATLGSFTAGQLDFNTGNCKLYMKLPSVITATNYINYQYFKYGNSNVIHILDPATGNFLTATGTWIDDGGCVPQCLDGVLHAEAYVFNDTWTYDYADFGDPFSFNNGSNRTISYANGVHPYKYGAKGQWRLQEKYLYQVERKQSTPHTDIAADGTYRVFNWYNWQAPGNVGSNKEWTLTNKITKYSPYGFEVENTNLYSIFASKLYGYDNSAITAAGTYVPHDQLSFQGFEEKFPLSPPSIKSGHLNLKFVSASPMQIYNYESHTGSRSLKTGGQKLQVGDVWATNAASTTGGVYHLVPATNYVLSFWIKNTVNTNLPGILMPSGSTVVSPVSYTKDKIDGWQRAELTFSMTAQATATNVTIDATAISDLYIDDIRIQPSNSAVITYVYSPDYLWLMAELDEQNYATFYSYDETGNLVQVKKETAKGISTVMHSRKNTKRTP